jgi:talin
MAVVLKVEIPSKGLTKSIRFMSEMGVIECCREVRDKTEVGGEDHGLLVPKDAGENAYWLKNDRTIGSYELENNTKVIFKKKHQMVKVRLMDDATKTFMLDTSVPVERILEKVGEHLGVKHSEEFGLMLEGKETEWLRNEQGLTDQNWEETKVVLFKKKFFYSDQYVDKDDPMALHLLYLQNKADVVSGEMPAEKDQALQLAAMNIQVEHGDYNKDVAEKLDLKKFLPQALLKERHLDREVSKAWRGVSGTNDLNAKYRYVQLCRTLKTYGVTTFVCTLEEQNKSKKKGKAAKAQPILFGVTKDRVRFMDPETKETKRRAPKEGEERGEAMEWKLTKIKRWAAQPQVNSITFDFGDHEVNLLVLKTKECKKISELISGYVDIIVKSRKNAAQALEVQEYERATVSDMSRPKGLSRVSYTVTGVGAGVHGARHSYTIGDPITDSEQALGAMMTLYDDFDTIGYKVPATMSHDDYSKDMEVSLHALSRNIRDMTAMKNFTRETIQMPMVQTAQYGEKLVMSARNAALAGDVVNEDLLATSKVVAGTLKDLLGVMDTATDNPGSDYANAIQVARKNYDAAVHLLKFTRENTLGVNSSGELIMEAGKAVAVAVDNLVQDCEEADMSGEGRVLSSIGSSISLSSSAMALGMLNADARRDVRKANQGGIKAMQHLTEVANKKDGLDPAQLNDLLSDADSVQNAIQFLNDSIESSEGDVGDTPSFKEATERLIAALDSIRSGDASRPEIIAATKDVAASGNRIVVAAQAVAEISDQKTRASLLADAKACANDVNQLIASAKLFTSDMGDEAKYDNLTSAADSMYASGQRLSEGTRRTMAMAAIRSQATDAAAAGTALVQAARLGVPSIKDSRDRDTLVKGAQSASDSISELIGSVKHLARDASDPTKQETTLQHAQMMAAESMSLAATARRLNPKINDLLAKADLKESATRVAGSMSTLLASCRDATSSLEQELEDSLENLESTSSELDALDAMAQSGLLKVTQKRNEALSLMSLSADKMGRDSDSLVRIATSRPNQTGEAARELSEDAAQVFTASKAILSSTTDKKVRKRVLEATRALNENAMRSVRAAQVVAQAGGGAQADTISNANLHSAGRGVSDSLSDLIAASRGLDTTVVDAVVKEIVDQAGRLDGSETGGDLDTAIADLMAATRTTSGAVSQLVAMSQEDVAHFSGAARVAASAIPGLVDAANAAAGLSAEPTKSAVLSGARDAVLATSSTIKIAMAAAASGDASSQGNLATASKEVSEGLGRLMGALGQDGEGRLEDAIQAILDATQKLDQSEPHTPRGGVTVADSISTLLKEVNNLAGLSTQIVSTARSSSTRLGKTAQASAETIQKIVRASIIAVNATPSSAPPEFVKGCHLVKGLTQQLVVNAGDPKRLNVIARGLAVSTSKLMQLAKATASAFPPAQRTQLEEAAKGLAQGTAKLAQAAKGVQSKQPGADQQLAGAARGLDDVVGRILAASSSAEGGETAADPVLCQQVTDRTRSVATVAVSLIRAAGKANQRSDDAGLQKEVSSAAEGVSEEAQALIKACSKLQPGAAEFDKGYGLVQTSLEDLDTASIGVAVGSFEPLETDKSHQSCQENLVELAKLLAAGVSTTVNGSRMRSSAALGRAALAVGEHVDAVVADTLAACSTTTDQTVRSSLLKVSKGVCDALLGLLETSRAAVSTGAKDDQRMVAMRAKESTAAISRLISELKSGVVLLRDIDDAMSVIEEAKTVLAQGASAAPGGGSYQTAKDELSDTIKHMASQVQRLVGTNKENTVALGTAATAVAADAPGLASAALRAASVASSDIDGLREGLVSCADTVISATYALVSATKVVAEDPGNHQKKHALTESFQEVSIGLGKLLEEGKRGAVGEMMCDSAIGSIQEGVTDLGSAALFAAAGQLEVTDSDLQLAGKDTTSEAVGANLVRSAKQLVVASQKLVGSTAGGQLESFAEMAKGEAKAVNAIKAKTKVLASMLADLAAQQALLHSAKAVAQATQGLVLAGKDAVRSPQDKDVQHAMAASSETVAQGISTLIALANRHAADDGGVSSIVNAQAEISNLLEFTKESALQGHDSMPPAHSGKTSAVAEDVVQACRDMSGAVVALTSATMAKEASETTEAAAKTGQSATLLLMRAIGASIATAPTAEIRQSVVESARACAQGAHDLLSASKEHTTTGVASTAVQSTSDAMAELVQKVVESSRGLPGGAGLKLQVEAGGDLESNAGKELENAASSIMSAMEQLLATQARKPKIPSVNIDTSGVTEAILTAAISVAEATHFLVQKAAVVQQERLDKQSSNPNVYHKDPMWANGLISAAKSVAGSTQQLVQSANRMVAGEAADEELPAVAKVVAESTAHLVTASRSKATAGSDSVSHLGQAARVVAASTAKLVKAAHAASALKEEEEMQEEAEGMTGSTIAKIEQHMRVLKAEKELEKARQEMGGVNRARYDG